MELEMIIKRFETDPITKGPVLILKEVAGDRVLRIWIGSEEAEAIRRELGQYPSPRPMTHDLFLNTLKAVNVRVTRIVITDICDGTFYAELVLEHAGESITVDSRPSDGIAMAVRFRAPIFVDERVLRKAAAAEEESDPSAEVEQIRNFLERLKPEDFGKYQM